MQSIMVYHVATEKPMYPGQKIIFDHTHHNGVYDRVMMFNKILEGEEVEGDLAEFIKSDLEKWGKVAFRELALEKIRIEEFPEYPSRMACLYTSESLDEARKWAQFFKQIGRDVYSIVKLRVNGKVFSGDACNCFDGVIDEVENLPKARIYWENSTENESPIIETLIDGDIVVEEVIEDYKE